MKITTASGQLTQQHRVVDESLGDEVYYLTFPLHDAKHTQQASREHFAPLPLGEPGMDDDVGQPGFILQRQEHHLRRPRSLATGDNAGTAYRTVVVIAA